MLSARRALIAITWLTFLLAAAPEPPPVGVVERVPPDQAIAVLGLKVADPSGKDIGRLVDILVGSRGDPQAAVIDFGGFMGVGSRKIAVHWSMLHFSPSDAQHPITLDLTPSQIKAAPEYKNDAKPAPVVTAPSQESNSPAASAITPTGADSVTTTAPPR